MVFGKVTSPSPWLDLLQAEREHYREAAASAEEYALSLKAENDRLNAELAAATNYVRGVETALSLIRTEPANG